MEFVKGCLLPVFSIFAFVGLIGLIMVMGVNFGEKKKCASYENITGRSTEYDFFGGCFVNTDSGWLTKDEYGQVIIAREGLSSYR